MVATHRWCNEVHESRVLRSADGFGPRHVRREAPVRKVATVDSLGDGLKDRPFFPRRSRRAISGTPDSESAKERGFEITSTSLRAVVTGPFSRATMRLACRAVLGRAMIERPPSDWAAART